MCDCFYIFIVAAEERLVSSIIKTNNATVSPTLYTMGGFCLHYLKAQDFEY